MNATGDYAIVIGIDRYPELESVPGAVEDAQTFVDWLLAIRIPAANITFLVNPKSIDISDTFDALYARLPKRGKIGRRLYLYWSGSTFHTYLDRIFLPSDGSEKIIRADSTERILRPFGVRAYANFFADGVFDEVVLVADVHEISYQNTPRVSGPPYRTMLSPQQANKFYVLAEPRGKLTPLLLDGLYGEAVINGQLNSDTIRRYVYNNWSISGEAGPESESNPGQPIVFDIPAKRPRRIPADERVRAYADDPALLDELGRRPFAEVLGQRLDEFWSGAKPRDAGAFIVNVDGPWGAGKTTVLNLLRAYLQDREDPWVVVEFNAWRQQRLRPPWWVLIKEVYRQSAASWRQIGIVRSLLLRMQWLAWRVRADWMPSMFAAVMIALALAIVWSAKDSGPQSAELALKIIIALAAAGAAIMTFTRSLAFGSARAAQTYAELRSDPLGPIVLLFKRLMRAIRSPVAVFVDDVDRCDSAYVVELLEGIQTLFRFERVAYVIAADRKWIVTSFEKAYESFSARIGEPGRPLGYLFLEKMFQISATLPLLSPQVRQRYWSRLLMRDAAVAAVDNERKQAEVMARETVRGLRTKEELDAKIEEVKGDPIQEAAMRAAAAKQITSIAAQEATRHRLQPCADLLESNPRAMKRLVNAFGFHQATHFLEGRNVSPEVLARWTILELRWPLLANYLATHPALVDKLGDRGTEVPDDLKALLGNDDLRRVVAGGPKDMKPLDDEAVRAIVGV